MLRDIIPHFDYEEPFRSDRDNDMSREEYMEYMADWDYDSDRDSGVEFAERGIR